MITVKVYFDDGDELVTRMNATKEEAAAYYLGNTFVRGHDDGSGFKEIKRKAIKVEFPEL